MSTSARPSEMTVPATSARVPSRRAKSRRSSYTARKRPTPRSSPSVTSDSPNVTSERAYAKAPKSDWLR